MASVYRTEQRRETEKRFLANNVESREGTFRTRDTPLLAP